jgi:hypothetical protein
LRQITKLEKEELYHSIRYSFLKHEELIALAKNPNFLDAKDKVVEGLSLRLDPFEKTKQRNFSIRTNPRVNYEADPSAQPGRMMPRSAAY